MIIRFHSTIVFITIKFFGSTFTRNGINKLLNALNHKKASGSDGISARILKVCSEEVADALVLIFSASIIQGKIPNDWRHAIITPVYKGGNKNRTNPENYRPIRPIFYLTSNDADVF